MNQRNQVYKNTGMSRRLPVVLFEKRLVFRLNSPGWFSKCQINLFQLLFTFLLADIFKLSGLVADMSFALVLLTVPA